MTRLIDRITPRTATRAGLVQVTQTWQTEPIELPVTYTQYASAIKSIAPLFAVLGANQAVVPEVKFAYQDRDSEYVDDVPVPAWLQHPSRLLARMMLSVDLVGNAYVHVPPGGDPPQVLRPDWTAVVHDERRIVGYAYQRGGIGSGGGPLVAMLPNEVVHWAGLHPDPFEPFLGMSWMVPLARKLNAITAMVDHQNQFFANAATPNMVITTAGRLNIDQRQEIEHVLRTRYEGPGNAGRTMLLEGGATVQAVGHSFKDMDFAALAAADEAAISQASGTPAVITDFAKGLEAATYNNYGLAMRKWADHRLRPLWRSVTRSIAQVAPVRPGLELTYDDRRVPALQQDAKDDAEIQAIKAETMGHLIRAGYEPDLVAAAVATNTLDTLPHTGKLPTTMYPDGMEPTGGTE